MYFRISVPLARMVLGVSCLSLPIMAQGPDRTLSCASQDGRRTVCQADTRNGVRFVRQDSGARCVEGYSWGYTNEGVWVDRGCRAEFALAGQGRDQNWERDRPARLEAGTVVPIRTNEWITAERADGRIFTGSVDDDVRGPNGRVAIPRGSSVEMIVRAARDGDLILDLESVTVYGQRYALEAQPDRIDARRANPDRRTAESAGGGALLGAIIGGIAGGGKGAAIGAGAGAAVGAGAELATRGARVRVPAESVLTFRLDQPISMGVADRGDSREGIHYHND